MVTNSLQHLVVYKSQYPKIRVGSSGDGGYVISNLPEPRNYDMLLSCGISNDVNFENDFLKYNDVPCKAYDGTVNGLPANAVKSIQFHKMNIGPENTSVNTNLHKEIEPYKNIFLKMDIESHEFRWAHTLSDVQMNKFKQIVIEFHYPFTPATFSHFDIDTPVSYKMAVLEKFAKTHRLIHFHANNCCGTTIYENTAVPNLFECTYLRNDIQTTNELNTDSIPSALDSKNTVGDEIVLNWYPFVHV